MVHIPVDTGNPTTPGPTRHLASLRRHAKRRQPKQLPEWPNSRPSEPKLTFKAQIETDTGIRPTWSPEAFADSPADVTQSINRVKASPFLAHTDQVRGFVYNDHTGTLTEI